MAEWILIRHNIICNTCLEMPTPLVSRWCSALLHMPNVQQVLLQFVNVMHPRLTDWLLNDIVYPVLSRGPRSRVFGGHRSAGKKVGVACSRKCSDACPVCTALSCRKMKNLLNTTCLRYGGKYYTGFVIILLFSAVKELWKSVKIQRSATVRCRMRNRQAIRIIVEIFNSLLQLNIILKII